LHLRSGDTIPCEVARIDEKGVTFKTPLSDATFIAHEKIKSVELIATRDSPRLSEPKRDRLLTLPRMQKNSPPTQLICSQNGDFLRGRVLEMDEKRLKVEVRLETRDIPRDRVAHLAGTQVGDHPYRIDRFLCRSGCEQHAPWQPGAQNRQRYIINDWRDRGIETCIFEHSNQLLDSVRNTVGLRRTEPTVPIDRTPTAITPDRRVI
jgi:hypothetical protein